MQSENWYSSKSDMKNISGIAIYIHEAEFSLRS